MTRDEIIRMAQEAGIDYSFGQELERFAALVAGAERERLCAAIKAEDDHCADGDYMLDSDDCISVIRGTWKRPVWAGESALVS